MAQVLTHYQEIRILEFLMDADQLGCGASRVTFECGADALRAFGVEIPKMYDEVIVKVSLGIGGCNQSMGEITAFLENPTAPLATIFAYGKFIEVMEYVDIISGIFRNCPSSPYDEYDIFFAVNGYEDFGLIGEYEWEDIQYKKEYEPENLYYKIDENETCKEWKENANKTIALCLEKMEKYEYWTEYIEAECVAAIQNYTGEVDYPLDYCERVYNVICDLIEINGETQDNYQLGIAQDGELVAYDYGYLAYSDKQLCSSDVADSVDCNEYGQRVYFRICIDNLQLEDNFKLVAEEMFSQIESDFDDEMSYDDEECDDYEDCDDSDEDDEDCE